MTRRSFRRLRGVTLVELVVTTALLSSLVVVVYGVTSTLARQRQELTAYASDLDQTTSVVDRVARAIRESRAVVTGTPDGRVRTGAGSLVVQGPNGGLKVFTLKVNRVSTWLRVLEYDARGLQISDSDWGRVGGLLFRYNARRPADVTLVTFEVLLPRRSPDALPAPLTTRARVLGGGRS